ncbi:GCN5-related N-acetyltransferas-like protein [Lindgomyces ingoldianus]|uniref:GCN5-related N-acetyltransferas-like protein n=1 Tax=Lindgomyces ingoldianus TaxID=673940 RepID=A0ACB6REN6_9PLEO|nr:GCN5-related N-acetyltransferas-like protein [Lindgomyces ingoldianus]KAF2477768.1 GCN5-related N-acetyltransferas-like protein [Lindgomyces ingoldianus]
MPEPFIRPIEPLHDLDACLHIFFATIDKGVDFEPARTIGSYVWCRPYLLLSPETCVVLDDGSGQAVGYIIGTESTSTFVKKWRNEYIPTLDPTFVPRPDEPNEDDPNEPKILKYVRRAVYDPEGNLLQKSAPTLLKQYPAHFHIDILPKYQNKGYGLKLMATFLNKIKDLGAGGVHLGMVAENRDARRFYERSGFRLFGEVMDSGESGEVGRTGDAIFMVKSF